MSVGYATSKGEIDNRAGDICRRAQQLFRDVTVMQGYLTQTPNADLVGMGYSDQDVADLKTAFTDLSNLGTIFVGQDSPVALPYDFRTFVRLIWGVGAF